MLRLAVSATNSKKCPNKKLCRKTERKFLIKADEVVDKVPRFSHPWNPNSEVVGIHLSTLVGPARVGVGLVRIPAGKEFFVYRSH